MAERTTHEGSLRLIADAVRNQIAALEAQLIHGASPSTSATASQEGALTSAKLSALMRDWGRLIAESRRRNVTVVVVSGHIGMPVMTRHPTDGTFIKCSYEQARVLDRDTPLRLVEIVSSDQAHFEVATPFDSVFERLSGPPYEVAYG